MASSLFPAANRGKTFVTPEAIKASWGRCLVKEARDFASMELLSALKAAAGSLEHFSLGIRHREPAGYLLLTALGVTAGGATTSKPDHWTCRSSVRGTQP